MSIMTATAPTSSIELQPMNFFQTRRQDFNFSVISAH
jgi:hypothetical protein